MHEVDIDRRAVERDHVHVARHRGAGGRSCPFGFSMVMSAVVATDETATLVVGVGSVDILGSSAVLVDSVAAERTVRAVVVPVLSDDSAASWAGLVDCSEALDFFLFFGVGSTSHSMSTTQIRTYRRCRPKRHSVLRERRPRFREPPPVQRTRPQLGRIGGHCVAWVSFHGDQPCQRHAESVGTVESPP
jgi:hypothetical protein